MTFGQISSGTLIRIADTVWHDYFPGMMPVSAPNCGMPHSACLFLDSNLP
jgi:hypothetical protein